ncbi:MAG: sterol desaturase family protein [Planctomycetota bacterium]
METQQAVSELIVSELLNLRKSVPVLGLCLLWCVESLRPAVTLRPGRVRHAIRNLMLTLLNAVVLSLTFGTLTIYVASETVDHQRGALFLVSTNLPVRMLAGVVLLDLWTWGWHHCNHRVSWLWRFHRVHHSDDAMDVTTAARFHLGELVLSSLVKLPWIAALGIDPVTLFIHETLLVAVSQFHHAAISLGSVDQILQWFLVTPDMHRIHHSREPVETNSNYASILSIWDRLLGTYRSTLRNPDQPTGLNEFTAPEFQTLSGMLRTPWVSMDSGDRSFENSDS